jgi:hypothetical protein
VVNVHLGPRTELRAALLEALGGRVGDRIRVRRRYVVRRDPGVNPRLRRVSVNDVGARVHRAWSWNADTSVLHEISGTDCVNTRAATEEDVADLIVRRVLI